MGVTTFGVTGYGKDVKEAFDSAREQALYDYGHAGYTGTIAEKDGWVVISGEQPRPLNDAVELGRKLIDDADPRVDDKWGPAGAIPIEGGGWYFFGWASE